ncbi:MAG: hypothetical protein QXG40_06330, partial [Ignisphaera sp.]
MIEYVLVRVIAVIIALVIASYATREIKLEKRVEDNAFLILGWLGLIIFAWIEPFALIILAMIPTISIVVFYSYMKILRWKWKLENRLRSTQDTANNRYYQRGLGNESRDEQMHTISNYESSRNRRVYSKNKNH